MNPIQDAITELGMRGVDQTLLNIIWHKINVDRGGDVDANDPRATMMELVHGIKGLLGYKPPNTPRQVHEKTTPVLNLVNMALSKGENPDSAIDNALVVFRRRELVGAWPANSTIRLDKHLKPLKILGL